MGGSGKTLDSLEFPGAAYFSTKKNRNVKEPLVSSHTIPVGETG
jgi:hypothetical protein